MAQESMIWTYDSLSAGDGKTKYTQDQTALWFKEMFGDGVRSGIGGELLVSGTNRTNLSVAAGRGMVDGHPYKNTSSYSIPTAMVPTVTAPTGHLVVLRSDPTGATGQTPATVRIAVVASPNGVATIPTALQNQGGRWEEPLASFVLGADGNLTLTDQRRYCSQVSTKELLAGSVITEKIANSAVIGAKIADAAVTTVKIADGNITTAKLADFSVSSGKIQDSSISGAKIAFNAITGSFHILDNTISGNKLQSGIITADKMAINAIAQGHIQGGAVDYRRLGTKTLYSINRQGGDGTHWHIPGGSNVDVGKMRFEFGVATMPHGTAAIRINFFTGFPVVPWVQVGLMSSLSTPARNPSLINPDGAGFYVETNGTAGQINVTWIAIGPG